MADSSVTRQRLVRGSLGVRVTELSREARGEVRATRDTSQPVEPRSGRRENALRAATEIFYRRGAHPVGLLPERLSTEYR